MRPRDEVCEREGEFRGGGAVGVGAYHLPDPAEQELAGQLASQAGNLRVQVQTPEGPTLLPEALSGLVRQLLLQVSRGHAVGIVTREREVGTLEAARLLGVSRPFLISRLLETGRLPYRLVGTHRRLLLADVLAYGEEQRRRRRLADELSAEAQELGLY